MGGRCWAWAALGCAACAAPEAPPAPPPPPAPVTWTLAGEVTLGAALPSSRPGFQEASALLGPDCTTAAARLGDHAPPCRAELWRPLRPAGEPLGDERALLLQVGQTTLLQTATGEEHLRRDRWTKLGPVLEQCLGAPLALPPARDPEGYRHLVVDAQGPAWVLHLSGANPCRLSGSLRLGILPDEVDVSALSADGVAWRAGGPQAALGVQRAAVRVELRDRFAELSPDERIIGLETLARDPDPEALTILQVLAASGGPGSTDAARALERRALLQQEPP